MANLSRTLVNVENTSKLASELDKCPQCGNPFLWKYLEGHWRCLCGASDFEAKFVAKKLREKDESNCPPRTQTKTVGYGS